METTNLVVLRGHLTRDPLVRELPSGSLVTQLEVTTRHEGTAVSVPVAVPDRSVAVVDGDEVVVVGHVARRFFRAGGVTQSRTEVIASQVVKATRRSSVERAVAKAVDALTGPRGADQ